MRNKQLFRATMISVVAAALGGGLQGCSRAQDAPTAVVPAMAALPKAAAALDVVKPVMACADLATFDLGAIGGAGSKITAAVETTNQAGRSICAVEGTLAHDQLCSAVADAALDTSAICRLAVVGCAAASRAMSALPMDARP
ncbi:hypothetical protein NDY24_14710 [Xanthomonas hortorum pv. pelargonii]|nr:hypothetical protein NDY24_14710 [Xanthomonas hortorum pv. pelargonii]